ncbi:MFS transporter [Meridianimarinicoccus sp. RP-17]|uniref:MFS transporter n=1 Tax=Meridianimarinicoccus zhengii TaxID=2056810 RepID=UPI000DAE2574|nr:MFS transporter [Phycocomes zhengii]
MIRHLMPVAALLLGSGLLMFAGGMNALILPVRGGAEGFSALALGALGTGWALGYVAGCLTMARLVGRVGHIRAFGVMAAMAAVAVLASLVFVHAWGWIVLRALSGFCFAGAAMIVESWLSERADARSRGTIFGVYTMVNLLATTAGQLSLSLGDTTGFLFFVLPAMVYCVALVPTAISASPTPAPLVSVQLDLGSLWRNSPVAVGAVFAVGISNGAFGTLAPVYANAEGLSVADVTLFASLPLLAGAAAQLPLGLISDRIERRALLVLLALAALAATAVFVLVSPEPRMAKIGLGAAFGAAIFTMYPVIVAHANDHAKPGTSIQVAAGLLMVFGVGTIIGPTLGGAMMARFGNAALFAVTGGAHVFIILFTLLRILRSAAVPDALKGDTPRVAVMGVSTPETAALATGEDPAQPIESVDFDVAVQRTGTP